MITETRLQRAWRDTRISVAREIGVAVIAGLLTWWLLPSDKAKEQLAGIGVAAVTVAIIWPCIEFAWNWFHAPMRMLRDRVSRIEAQLAESPRQQSPETIELMRHVGRLKDILLKHGSFDDIEEGDVIERLSVFEASDHLIWQIDRARQLRNDFLNRCGMLFKAQRKNDEFLLSRSELEQDKIEMKDFAEQLLAELKAYSGP